ncbi:unnamed protein product [Diamesa serratosioi]
MKEVNKMLAMDNGRCLTLATAPRRVLETIFNHLGGKDLLNALVVCRSFNDVISTSDVQMDKIRLKFDKTMSKFMEFKITMKVTNRNYQHLSISHDYVFFINELDYFDWKSIRVQKMSFDKFLLEFLKKFEETVEELEFDQVYIDQNGLYSKAALFQNLEVFKINGTDNDAVYILSTFVRNIYQFKELKMPQSAFGRSYMEFFDSCVKLEKLHLTTTAVSSIHETENSLYLMSDSLKELTMECFENSTMQFIWREMRALEKLNIKVQLHEDNNPQNFNLQENFSITKLYIQNKMLPDHVFKEISVATPNLEIWRFAQLNLRIKSFSFALDSPFYGFGTSTMDVSV